MRFKDYSSDKVDFPEIKELQVPEQDFSIEFSHPTVVINALPEHPYDFPQVSLLLNRLYKHAHILSTFMKKYNVTTLILLISKKKRPEIMNNSIISREDLKIVYTKPVYPVTKKKISSFIKGKEFDVIGWYQFYAFISRVNKLLIPGIPVSLSRPAVKRIPDAGTIAPDGSITPSSNRIHMLVPLNTTFREIAKAASIPLDDSVMCTDHPFCGTLVTPDTKVEKLKPRAFILFPGNIRQTASPWLKIKSMVCGYCSFSFSDTFDSRPLQLDTPCQKCLYCTKICPQGIVPLMLSALYEAEDIKEAAKYSPELCIECGLCSYICPSGIPLLHNIKGLKKELGVLS